MKSLRTKRDEQQWILDLALNMRGRVQNFERDDWETPARAHNYRMLPKMWRKKAEHDEALKVEKSFFPTRNFAPLLIFSKLIFFLICQTLFLLIVGTLSRFKIIY